MKIIKDFGFYDLMGENCLKRRYKVFDVEKRG
jgi:hypothetical protein